MESEFSQQELDYLKARGLESEPVEKQRIVLKYAANEFTNYPHVQEHEQELVEGWRETLELCGLDESRIQDEIQQRLKIHRRDMRITAPLIPLAEIGLERRKNAEAMREKKLEADIEKRREKKILADDAMQWAHSAYPTASYDKSLDFLKNKAAEHLGKSRDTLDRWLKY